MLLPKKTKYRKYQRGRNRGKATSGCFLAFGEYGLQSTGLGFITDRQIESARRAMTRYIKRGGKVWIRIFPDKPITSKPQEVRMGKGKGALDHWVAIVKAGRIMFELDGVPRDVAEGALKLAAQKLPCLTKIVVRHDIAE